MGNCACYVDPIQLEETQKPLFFFLELTPSCNNRCPGCSNVFAQDRTPAPLSAAEWKEVIDNLAPHVGWLKLTGGEPTLHPQFQEIVAHISRLDIPFTLFTNGRWPEPESLIAFLLGIPQLNGLLVSLHGPDAPAHEAFTGVVGSFAETVTNIRRATKAGFLVSTSTVVTRHSANRVDEMIALAAELGASHAVFNRYIGPSLPGIEAGPAQEIWALQQVEKRITHRPESLTVRLGTPLPHCFLSADGNGCLAGIAFCTVDPWGNVRPCNHAPLLCGNLLEQPIEEIWHGPAISHWRNLVPELCWQCGELSRCHGGCRADALLRGLNHDPLMREPLPASRFSLDFVDVWHQERLVEFA